MNIIINGVVNKMKKNVRYKETSQKFVHAKGKPMSTAQIAVGGILVVFVVNILVDMFRLNYWICESIAAIIYLAVMFKFYLVTPLTEHLSYSKRNKHEV